MQGKLAGWMAVGLLMFSAAGAAAAQGGEVTVHLAVQRGSAPAKEKTDKRLVDTAVWLTPMDGAPARPLVRGVYRMVQKNKQFTPHMLVIPVGSSVEFPNQDPFFHNVFSLYNGKAFDLGLYESGSTKTVPFAREGVSYIFCNIHPEMGAVVLTVSTPYYAAAKEDGSVTIANVAPGRYRLHVWSQGMKLANTEDEGKLVQVTAQGAAIGPMELVPAQDVMEHHKNKFGEDYPASHPPAY
jgi:plastocyanin